MNNSTYNIQINRNPYFKETREIYEGDAPTKDPESKSNYIFKQSYYMNFATLHAQKDEDNSLYVDSYLYQNISDSSDLCYSSLFLVDKNHIDYDTLTNYSQIYIPIDITLSTYTEGGYRLGTDHPSDNPLYNYSLRGLLLFTRYNNASSDCLIYSDQYQIIINLLLTTAGEDTDYYLIRFKVAGNTETVLTWTYYPEKYTTKVDVSKTTDYLLCNPVIEDLPTSEKVSGYFWKLEKDIHSRLYLTPSTESKSTYIESLKVYPYQFKKEIFINYNSTTKLNYTQLTDSATRVKLENNYCSVGELLEASNELIEYNYTLGDQNKALYLIESYCLEGKGVTVNLNRNPDFKESVNPKIIASPTKITSSTSNDNFELTYSMNFSDLLSLKDDENKIYVDNYIYSSLTSESNLCYTDLFLIKKLYYTYGYDNSDKDLYIPFNITDESQGLTNYTYNLKSTLLTRFCNKNIYSSNYKLLLTQTTNGYYLIRFQIDDNIYILTYSIKSIFDHGKNINQVLIHITLNTNYLYCNPLLMYHNTSPVLDSGYFWKFTVENNSTIGKLVPAYCDSIDYESTVLNDVAIYPYYFESEACLKNPIIFNYSTVHDDKSTLLDEYYSYNYGVLGDPLTMQDELVELNSIPDSKFCTIDSYISQSDSFNLTVSPSWVSINNASPVALEVKLEYEHYYLNSEGTSELESVNDSYICYMDKDVPLVYKNGSSDPPSFIDSEGNCNINELTEVLVDDINFTIIDNNFKIYDFYEKDDDSYYKITMTITPLMIFNKLDYLSKVITIDPSKISTGDCEITEWRYTTNGNSGMYLNYGYNLYLSDSMSIDEACIELYNLNRFITEDGLVDTTILDQRDYDNSIDIKANNTSGNYTTILYFPYDYDNLPIFETTTENGSNSNLSWAQLSTELLDAINDLFKQNHTVIEKNSIYICKIYIKVKVGNTYFDQTNFRYLFTSNCFDEKYAEGITDFSTLHFPYDYYFSTNLTKSSVSYKEKIDIPDVFTLEKLDERKITKTLDPTQMIITPMAVNNIIIPTGNNRINNYSDSLFSFDEFIEKISNNNEIYYHEEWKTESFDIEGTLESSNTIDSYSREINYYFESILLHFYRIKNLSDLETYFNIKQNNDLFKTTQRIIASAHGSGDDSVNGGGVKFTSFMETCSNESQKISNYRHDFENNVGKYKDDKYGNYDIKDIKALFAYIHDNLNVQSNSFIQFINFALTNTFYEIDYDDHPMENICGFAYLPRLYPYLESVNCQGSIATRPANLVCLKKYDYQTGSDISFDLFKIYSHGKWFNKLVNTTKNFNNYNKFAWNTTFSVIGQNLFHLSDKFYLTGMYFFYNSDGEFLYPYCLKNSIKTNQFTMAQIIATRLSLYYHYYSKKSDSEYSISSNDVYFNKYTFDDLQLKTTGEIILDGGEKLDPIGDLYLFSNMQSYLNYNYHISDDTTKSIKMNTLLNAFNLYSNNFDLSNLTLEHYTYKYDNINYSYNIKFPTNLFNYTESFLLGNNIENISNIVCFISPTGDISVKAGDKEYDENKTYLWTPSNNYFTEIYKNSIYNIKIVSRFKIDTTNTWIICLNLGSEIDAGEYYETVQSKFDYLDTYGIPVNFSDDDATNGLMNIYGMDTRHHDTENFIDRRGMFNGFYPSY